MKKVVYFLLVSLLLFASCKKDASNPVNTDTVPAPPTLASPTDTSSNIAVPVVLTWKESSGSKSYTLQVSASSSFSSFVFNKSDITTTTQRVPDLNYLAVYYWRVSATNSAGTSDWSKVWSFTTTGEAALVPQLSLPANGSVDQKLSPVLTWNQVSNASSYTLQISTNSSFTSFVVDEDSLTTTSKQVTDLSGTTKYYWRVSATNTFGTKGWSETWSFTTGVAPVPPTLLSPIDGATDISLPPTLTWNVSTGATSYILQVATDNSFASMVYNSDVGNVLSKQIYGLSEATIYHWRVVATNGFGMASPSTSWSFTTKTVICGSQLIYTEKTYNIVKIGPQCWLKENLDIGTMLQGIENPSNNSLIEKHCYNNDTANCRIYGGLYQWNEAMQYIRTEKAQGVCPNGWHIPTKSEFEILSSTVNNDGNALKVNDTNSSGFTALFSGYRIDNGYFNYLGTNTIFWSSTENNDTKANYLYLTTIYSNILLSDNNKEFGFSIRCIKD
ncbi:MAG: FISUMP domain-containing protein [Ignavibacteria bacterium]|nr:FISUMP domain-containing protein [Ignavibacteria bacterium]